MPTRLILVRHGQTLHNVAGKIAGWTDSPLSEVGLAQAERAADYIATSYRLDVVYSSPLQRARHTAEAISQRHGLSPVLRCDLKELNFGALENSTESELSVLYPEVWTASLVLDDLDFAWPNGERRADFFGRVLGAFAEIAAAHEGETVAVVAHGGVLGAYLAEISEGRPYLWKDYLVRNCSLTEVEVDDGRAVVVDYDNHSYLPDSGRDPLIESLTGQGGGRTVRPLA